MFPVLSSCFLQLEKRGVIRLGAHIDGWVGSDGIGSESEVGERHTVFLKLISVCNAELNLSDKVKAELKAQWDVWAGD